MSELKLKGRQRQQKKSVENLWKTRPTQRCRRRFLRGRRDGLATVRSPNLKLRIPATTLDPTPTPARFHQPESESQHQHYHPHALTFLHSRIFFLYISHSVKFSKCHFAVISWIIRLQLRWNNRIQMKKLCRRRLSPCASQLSIRAWPHLSAQIHRYISESESDWGVVGWLLCL